MKTIDVGQSVQAVANVGVIVGIFFLIVEINQNTPAIEAQTSQNRADAAVFEADTL